MVPVHTVRRALLKIDCSLATSPTANTARLERLMTDQQTTSLSQSVMGETCARCHTTQEWGTSSWCPNCGYYPTINSEGVSDNSWKDAMPVEEESVPEGNLFAQLPGWFWILMGGIVCIVMTGFYIRIQADEAESTRGMIALGILPFALTTMAIAHLLASRQAMKHDPRIRFADAIISWFTIWQPSIGQLPDSRKRIWSMTWGMTAVVTSLLVIGGIDYNAPFRNTEKVKPKPFGNKIIQAVTGAAKAAGQGGSAASMEEALGQLSDPSMVGNAGAGGAQDMEGALKQLTDSAAGGLGGSMEDAMAKLGAVPGQLEDMAKSAQEDLEATEATLCILYGVATNDEQLPTSFLFAGKPRNDYQHVAEIQAEDLDKQEYRRLAIKLSKKVQNRPAVPTTYDAIWVDPVLVCKIRYSQMNEDGTVRDAEFDSIVRDDSRKTANRRSVPQHGRR